MDISGASRRGSPISRRVIGEPNIMLHKRTRDLVGVQRLADQMRSEDAEAEILVHVRQSGHPPYRSLFEVAPSMRSFSQIIGELRCGPVSVNQENRTATSADEDRAGLVVLKWARPPPPAHPSLAGSFPLSVQVQIDNRSTAMAPVLVPVSPQAIRSQKMGFSRVPLVVFGASVQIPRPRPCSGVRQHEALYAQRGERPSGRCISTKACAALHSPQRSAGVNVIVVSSSVKISCLWALPFSFLNAARIRSSKGFPRRTAGLLLRRRRDLLDLRFPQASARAARYHVVWRVNERLGVLLKFSEDLIVNSYRWHHLTTLCLLRQCNTQTPKRNMIME